MKQRRQKLQQELTPRMREYIAENMKERIYATITLLALIVALWQTAGAHSALGVIASMLGSVLALWLATLVSSRMSHHVVHGKAMGSRDLGRLAFTSSGLFVPAIIPTIFVLSSIAGLMTLKNALMAGMAALLLSLFLLSYTAGRRIYTNPIRLFIVSLAEMAVGIGVILLKLAIGE